MILEAQGCTPVGAGVDISSHPHCSAPPLPHRIVVAEVEVSAEPEADVGVVPHQANELLGVAAVVQPGTPVLHMDLLNHLDSTGATGVARGGGGWGDVA